MQVYLSQKQRIIFIIFSPTLIDFSVPCLIKVICDLGREDSRGSCLDQWYGRLSAMAYFCLALHLFETRLHPCKPEFGYYQIHNIYCSSSSGCQKNDVDNIVPLAVNVQHPQSKTQLLGARHLGRSPSDRTLFITVHNDLESINHRPIDEWFKPDRQAAKSVHFGDSNKFSKVRISGLHHNYDVIAKIGH